MLGTFAQAGIVGTVPYMSPEMAEGRWEEVCTLSDVYGLGAILYAMLTGRPPFTGRNTVETLDRLIRGDLRPPREINRLVDHELTRDLPKVSKPQSRAALRVGRCTRQRSPPPARTQTEHGRGQAVGRSRASLLGPAQPISPGSCHHRRVSFFGASRSATWWVKRSPKTREKRPDWQVNSIAN